MAFVVDDSQSSGALHDLAVEALAILDRHWRPEGYTCPNPTVYPWQWLWDSCFHAVVWAEAGDDRAVVELRTVFAGQDPATGFVPHMGYQRDPGRHEEFWGRRGWSSLTQPPMYGHAVAELVGRGVVVPPEVVEAATAGLRFLLEERRRSPAGLVELVHPWESGADDSARWDDLIGGPSVTPAARRERKGELLDAVLRSPGGAPIANGSFPVGSVGFSSLVAFNAAELARHTGDAALAAAAGELGAAVASRWNGDLGTWVDDGPTAAGSGRARTAEVLCALLVDPRPEAFVQLIDPTAFGAAYGPTGVHRGEPTYSGTGYWRGPSWPQVDYLLWVAERRAGRPDVAGALAEGLIAGAAASGFAEYWDADTGAAGGAVPQSWTTLAWVVQQAG